MTALPRSDGIDFSTPGEDSQARLEADHSGATCIWWLGQSGFLVRCVDRALVFDPYLSDALARKYAGSDTPHERLTPIPVSPDRLGFVDLILASHRHTDHMDVETLRPLMASGRSRLVVPAAELSYAEDLLELEEGRLIGVDAGETAALGGISVRAVAAAHERVETDRMGRSRYLGYLVRIGGLSIYHAGDTIPRRGLPEDVGPVDLALLPINGRDPARGVAGNLTPDEAAELARSLPARWAVPCHYGMFAFNTGDPGDFVRACASRGQRCQVLRPGQRWNLSGQFER